MGTTVLEKQVLFFKINLNLTIIIYRYYGKQPAQKTTINQIHLRTPLPQRRQTCSRVEQSQIHRSQIQSTERTVWRMEQTFQWTQQNTIRFSTPPRARWVQKRSRTLWKHWNSHCKIWFIQAQYPHFPYLLSELIKQRQAERQLFKESELWFLLFALAAAKQDIKKHSKKLGDIKP